MFRAAIGRRALEQAVVALRRSLDPSQNDIATLADIPAFDVTAAWQLYQKIFAPAEAIIGKAQVVYVVPDAALQSLPLGVLVTAKPQAPITDLAGYREVPWPARRYADDGVAFDVMLWEVPRRLLPARSRGATQPFSASAIKLWARGRREYAWDHTDAAVARRRRSTATSIRCAHCRPA